MSSVLASKQADLEKCLRDIREDWALPSGRPFEEDDRKQRLIVLSLQRAFENLLDMAGHLVRTRKLGWPASGKETFGLLKEAGLISEEACATLRECVGMRNILVHRYKKIDFRKVREVVEERLGDILSAGQTLCALGPDTLADPPGPSQADGPPQPG